MRVINRADAKEIETKDASELPAGTDAGVAAFASLDEDGAPAPAVGDKAVHTIYPKNAKSLYRRTFIFHIK